MNFKHLLTHSLLGFTVVCGSLQAQDDALISVTQESEHSITKGVQFLLSKQEEAGNIGSANTPAFTALALRAILSDPNRDHDKAIDEKSQKALDWLLSQQKEDGGIYQRGQATYNTAATIMALLAADSEKYKTQILKARAYLVGQQAEIGDESEDSEFDGGFGYGGDRNYADMSNTYMALEAIYHSRQLAHDSGSGEQPELDWEAAIKFVSRSQNLQATNDMKEKVGNDGGFVYYPGDSKAGETKDEDGKVALRSYGSISYAGLLSLVYADLKKDDPRVTAVIDWLGDNFAINENPGLDQQGLFYYYLSMSKSLAAANLLTLETDEGEKIDWRRQLAVQLVNKQREDGSWVNDKASRWMENNPILVTAYATTALEQIHATMPALKK